jgi:chemotaxis signal transduction protein
MPKKGQGQTALKQYLAMRLGEHGYACDLACVQEIVSRPVLEPSLDGPELLVGMYAGSRGPLPVLDLLGRPPDECPLCSMSLVVFKAMGSTVGMLADESLNIVEFDPQTIGPRPIGSNSVLELFLDGLVSVKGSDYYLLNLDMVVSAYLGAAAVLPPSGDAESL